MRKFLDKNLISLAKSFETPLYIVGGFVRNFLIDGTISQDIDLAGAILAEDLIEKLAEFDFNVIAQYKRTGTVVFSDQKNKYEFTCFRLEKYKGGEHTPYQTTFTLDIKKDALRRDFKCNAVYYDIANDKFVDPLNGINDIKNKILDTVTCPQKVFCHDGLRIMRLARFAGQLDFQPTKMVMENATLYADNVKQISPERIYAELVEILKADKAYNFSNKQGHYKALKILEKTGVLDVIFPELTEGRDMAQRADFHLYDVLEHSLRCALYADEEVRLASLLHDIGKPYCFKKEDSYYRHFLEGEKIAQKVLKRLKVSNKIISEVKFLIRQHMVDIDCSMKENKVKKFIVKNHRMLSLLLKVKQADYRASLEQNGIAPTLEKWEKIYDKMIDDKTPFSLNELKISAKHLMEIGFKGEQIGKELNKLFDYAIINPDENTHEKMFELAKRHYANLEK